jgi:hypothetical protein
MVFSEMSIIFLRPENGRLSGNGIDLNGKKISGQAGGFDGIGVQDEREKPLGGGVEAGFPGGFELESDVLVVGADAREAGRGGVGGVWSQRQKGGFVCR